MSGLGRNTVNAALRAALAPVLGFFTELYRRKVAKVGAVYLIVAFAVMEVASNFFSALQLPAWAATLVAVLLILGFPLAVGLAWAFEITPQGIRFELPLERAAATAPPPPRQARPPLGPADQVWSIAVLPFVDMSPEQDQGFFTEGVAEEIRHALARVEGLSVVARTSSAVFRGASLDVREIGLRLGVSAVLEGSLRKWQDRVVIATQLISVTDGFELWSDTYEGGADEVLAVQGRIAAALLRALAPRLASTGPLIRGHTSNSEAHRAFLLGRHLAERSEAADLERAVQHFRRAVELDPGYAAAHVGISDALALMTRYGHCRPADAMPEAKAAALRALHIDPQLSAAHKSLAVTLHRFDHDAAAAEFEFRNAIRLNQGYASARYWLGEFLTMNGRFDEAAEVLQLALDLDPASTIGSAHLVTAYFLAGHQDRATRQALDTLDLNPRSVLANHSLGQLLHRQGRPAEAVPVLEQALLLSPDDPEHIAALAMALAASGRTAEASSRRDQLAGMMARRWAVPYHRAAVDATLGQADRALARLQACFEERAYDAVWIGVDPAFDSLRGLPGFQRIADQVSGSRTLAAG